MKIFQGALAALSLAWHTDVVQAADDGIQVHATFERPVDNVFEGSGEDRHIVCPGNANGRAAALQSASKFHLETKGRGCMALTMNSAKAAALAKNKNIDLVEIDQTRYPMGGAPGPGLRGGGDAGSFRKRPSRGDGRRLQSTQNDPWGIAAVQANQVAMGSGPAKVCIIDSGYDNGHEDLPFLPASAFDTNSPTPADTDGCSHGSHVAGTIAALDNNVGVIGVAPSAELHIVKVFGNDCGWSYASELVGALESCVLANATIVSMSLGGGRRSNAESDAFASALTNDGVLSIAAAGNDGNTRMSYPASYDSVVSVAATDSSNVLAGFSQRNSQVELAAPGVDVLSTVLRDSGTDVSFMVDGTGYSALGMDESPYGTGSGQLFNCGLMTNSGDCAGAPGGHVCLIQRGDISFADKVNNCAAGGGSAAVIYNNEAGSLSGTLTSLGPIPAVGISQADGDELANPANNHLGKTASVVVEPSDYALYDGTSMATPHVSGVAALVWSHCSACTATEVRTALQDSAKDLGAGGRDTSYGYGLVQAKDALDLLQTSCCAAGTTTTTLPPPTTTTVAGTTTTTTTTPPPPTTTTTAGPVTFTEKWSCTNKAVDALTVCQESYSSSTECEAVGMSEGASCGNGKKVCHKYMPSYCQGTGPVTTTVAPPSECNNNNVCDLGEDCNGCSDCARINGPPSSRGCCGDDIVFDDARCI